MHKFFAKKIINEEISFFDKDVNHLLKVLRKTINDEILVTYEGCKYLAKISSLQPLRAQVIKQIDTLAKTYEINVFMSSIKPNAMELAIRKAVELDVDNFYIFLSDYSQNNIVHNLKRYQTIISECAKQCNRTNLMNLKVIANEQVIELLKTNDINLIADFFDNNHQLTNIFKPTFKKIGIIIGPEGGFNDNDICHLKTDNTYIINLTNTILRSETAMIYMLSVIDYLMKGNN